MTWCEYRKLGLEATRGRDLAIGASSGVDFGSILILGAGLVIVVELATSKKVAGFGRHEQRRRTA